MEELGVGMEVSGALSAPIPLFWIEVRLSFGRPNCTSASNSTVETRPMARYCRSATRRNPLKTRRARSIRAYATNDK